MDDCLFQTAIVAGITSALFPLVTRVDKESRGVRGKAGVVVLPLSLTSYYQNLSLLQLIIYNVFSVLLEKSIGQRHFLTPPLQCLGF